MTAPLPHVSAYDLLREWATPLRFTLIRRDGRGLPPTNIAAILPVIITSRVGGVPTVPIDSATILFEACTGDLDTAEALAAKLQAAILHQLPGYMATDGRAWVKGTRMIAGPAEVPLGTNAIARVNSTYAIDIRTRHTSRT